VTKEVVDYIVNARLSGASDEIIRKVLLDAKYSEEDIDVALREAPCIYSYFDKLRDALFAPHKLFSELKNEKLNASIKFLAITSVFAGLLYSIVSLVLIYLEIETGSKFLLVFGNAILLFLPFIIAILFLLVSVAANFILAGILHALVKLARGHGSYVDSFKIIVYSSAPLIIDALIVSLPYEIGNIVVSVWSLIIMIVGISVVHSISRLKSAVTLFIPIALIAVVIISLLIRIDNTVNLETELSGPKCSVDSGQWCYKTETSDLCVSDESDCWSALALKFGQQEFCDKAPNLKKRDVCKQLVR
jgi:hypothetical protein